MTHGSVVIVIQHGKLLCVSRRDNLDDFGLPGGKVEPGERFAQAAIREAREEAGLVISENDISFFHSAIATFDGKKVRVTAFLADPAAVGEPTSQPGEGVIMWSNSWDPVVKGSFGSFYSAMLERWPEIRDLQEFYATNFGPDTCP